MATNGKPAGDPARIAIPVATDSKWKRTFAMSLWNTSASTRWMLARLPNPGGISPARPFIARIAVATMPASLAAADAAHSPARRDISLAAFKERLAEGTATNPDANYVVHLHRALFTYDRRCRGTRCNDATLPIDRPCKVLGKQ